MSDKFDLPLTKSYAKSLKLREWAMLVYLKNKDIPDWVRKFLVGDPKKSNTRIVRAKKGLYKKGYITRKEFRKDVVLN
jgi:hypothetical protein